MSGNPALIDFIRARIAATGPIPFRWFMEQALYHPGHGYYASGKGATGRKGDYFTNVSVGPLFGRLLAIQFREMWQRMGASGKFTIVEQGADNGNFARDVLEAMQASATDFARAVSYIIIEPFPVLEKRQRETLAGFPLVEWRPALSALEPFQGLHFSNELVDAMPVHLVKFTGGEWRERFVDWKDNRFEWLDAPPSSEDLRLHLKKLPGDPGENYTTEVNLDALEWLDALSSRLEAGYALIADYGHPRGIYYAPERTGGTLACFANHRRHSDPFQDIGLGDITAQVEFTSLAERARTLGLRVAGYADQHHFMTGLGKEAFPGTQESPDAAWQKSMREFKTLMHPTFMGLHFKFLALEKNLVTTSSAPLAGFQFTADSGPIS